MTDPSRVAIQELRGFIGRVLQSVVLPAQDAYRVAELMAEADARGADGHGVFRLPQYVKRIQSRGINTQPNIRVLREQAAIALVSLFSDRIQAAGGVHGCVG